MNQIFFWYFVPRIMENTIQYYRYEQYVTLIWWWNIQSILLNIKSINNNNFRCFLVMLSMVKHVTKVLYTTDVVKVNGVFQIGKPMTIMNHNKSWPCITMEWCQRQLDRYTKDSGVKAGSRLGDITLL